MVDTVKAFILARTLQFLMQGSFPGGGGGGRDSYGGGGGGRDSMGGGGGKFCLVQGRAPQAGRFRNAHLLNKRILFSFRRW